MTQPSITYGVGYQEDFSTLPPTGTDSADPLTGIIEEILYDDWMRIYGVPDSVNDEYRGRRTVDLTSLNIGSTLYNKWRVKFKTEASTPGLAGQIKIEYTDATVEEILVPTFTDNVFKTFSGSLVNTGKTVKYIYYYLNDSPDSVAATGQSAYFDFFMLYKGDFTLPNVGHGAQFTPPPRYAKQPIPSRITDIIQGMGGESASFTCSSDLDVGTWKRVGDYVDAQVFYEIAHELGSTADFVWLDTGEEQFKTVLEEPIIHRYADRRTLDLKFTEYSRCNAARYNYIERFGLNF